MLKFIVHLIVLFLVSAKVQNLQDYYVRLIHQTQPLPSGNDIANTLKSLSASLLGKLFKPKYMFSVVI